MAHRNDALKDVLNRLRNPAVAVTSTEYEVKAFSDASG
jgi:hypothetical protein